MANNKNEDQRFQALISFYKTHFQSHKNFSDKLYTTLLSYEVLPEYENWKPQISAILRMIRKEYSQKIPCINSMLSLLESSYSSLISPITHNRFIILGKTRVGKSNLGNALTNTTSFETADGWNSKTKNHGAQKVKYENSVFEFIDTQGIDDTDNPDEVFPKLKSMLEDIKFQYHGVLFVLKYESISVETIEEVLRYLKNLFGRAAIKQTVLVFTSCPSRKRFLSFDECTEQMLGKDVTINEELKTLLRSFKAIKFVDLPEPNDLMEDNEIQLTIRNRKREVETILRGLYDLDFPLNNPKRLRLSVLKMIHAVSERFAELKSLKETLVGLNNMVEHRERAIFVLRKIITFFYEDNPNLKAVFQVNRTLSEVMSTAIHFQK